MSRGFTKLAVERMRRGEQKKTGGRSEKDFEK
jgi:hypothetical protein